MSERPAGTGRPDAAVRRVVAPVTLAHNSLEAVAVAAAVRGDLVLAGIAPVLSPHPLPSPRYLDVLIRQEKVQERVDRLIGERLAELAALLPARYVLRHSDVPVLVVPVDGAAPPVRPATGADRERRPR